MLKKFNHDISNIDKNQYMIFNEKSQLTDQKSHLKESTNIHQNVLINRIKFS